jgi:hypothetical protein
MEKGVISQARKSYLLGCNTVCTLKVDRRFGQHEEDRVIFQRRGLLRTAAVRTSHLTQISKTTAHISPVSCSSNALDLHIYEGASVNTTQMGIKRKTWDTRTWKKHLFLGIFSNINTLAPSIYQCVETRSIEVFWLLFRSLPRLAGHHLRLSNVLERISRPRCEALYATNTSHRKQETFPYEYPLHWVLLPTKKRTI